ncbi:MAG: alkaline phosphatase [Chitinophagaceae bacterium]|nr:alkaline phosphatase [Chitinophagaceae bacterium]
MNRYLLLALGMAFYTALQGQTIQYTAANAHAHNDYEHNIPFVQAFGLGFGSIESDVILQNDQLYVAHNAADIKKRPLLFEETYIKPLNAAVSSLQQELVLLIDLKTEALSTLQKVISIIQQYPGLTGNSKLKFVITGNQPPASTFGQYPSWIYFDGNINDPGHIQHIDRIGIFSDNFRKYTHWNGKGNIPGPEITRLKQVIEKAHSLHKKIRFWGCPDNINTWYTFMDLQVDYINTDRIEELAVFLKKLSSTTSLPANQYELYQPTYAVDGLDKPVKNIILMIGDGTGLTQWYAGYTGNKARLNVFNMRRIGLSLTRSADSYITDSGAGGTAMATGNKTNNNFIAVLPDSTPVPSIPELLIKKNIRSAIISTGDITDATPASFYAHVPDRNASEIIAAHFLKSDADILIGSGEGNFNKRKDGRNILQELKEQKGYTTITDINGIDTVTNRKLVLLDRKAGRPSYKGRGNLLQRSLAFSIDKLKQNKNGFFIMAEGAQVDWAAHNNKLEWMVQEVQDLDKAIGDMMRFVDENKETLLIVTADHETGGLTLLNGSLETGKVAGQFSSDDHSAVCVPVFAYGPQSNLFTGVYSNTEIFHKIMLLFNKSKSGK